MSFDVVNGLTAVENPAVSVGSGKVPTDVSSTQEVTSQWEPDNGASASTAIGEPTNYNGQDITFNIDVPSNSRVLFDKSYIRLDGFGCYMNGGTTCTAAATGMSIPWNPIAALLDTAEIQFNSQNIMVEKINQELGHASMVKMLTRYTKEALDSMGERFFVPTIESQRDLNTGINHSGTPTNTASGLSQESIDRAHFNLVREVTGSHGIKAHSKNIYLHDLFDSVRAPAAFFLQKIKVTIHIKAKDQILFADQGALYANNIAPIDPALMRYFVTRATMFLTMVDMTENQLAKDAQVLSTSEAIFRESYSAFDARAASFTTGASIRDSNIINMQAAAFMFPSNLAGDTFTHADGRVYHVGCNPYQYCYSCGAGGLNGVTSYQHRYNGLCSPKQPITVYGIGGAVLTGVPAPGCGNNTDLFHQYRLLTRKTATNELSTALNFESSMGTDFEGPNGRLEPALMQDNNPYVLFCAQFYPLNAAFHKNLIGSNHEITITGGTASTIIIVRIRTCLLELLGNYQIRTCI